MVVLAANRPFVGQRVLRLEDARLLRGSGTFVDDVDVRGQLTMRVVRSVVPHARVVRIDIEAARALPGVKAVLTGADLAAVEPIPLRLFDWLDLEPYLQRVLAVERVRYVGEPVAVVLAESAYLAEDAADLVDVTYEPIPHVLSAADAIAAGAPALFAGRSNEVETIERSYGDIEAGFAAADIVVELDLSVGRHTGAPLETRGLVADYDPGRRQLTVWGATLVTHYHRRVLARMLGLPVTRITMRWTDVGGSFGVRGDFFPEDFLVAYLAVQHGCAVKWVEDRAEHLVATTHAREQRHRISGAFAANGAWLGLRDEIWHDKGAYIRPTGVVVAEMTAGMLPGPYRIGAFAALIHVALTNKTPIGPYRGPGRYQGTFAREQLLDVAAERLGLDPLELRQRNLLARKDIPYAPGHSIAGELFQIDSADCSGMLDKAVAASSFAAWRLEATELRGQGRLVGTGVGCWMDKSGLGLYETGGVEIDAQGGIRVFTGGASTGQGIETVMAQIAADELGVDPSAIEVMYGDTDLVPDGVGSWSSRSTVIGGAAVRAAAIETAEKARRVAAELLEAAPSDLELRDGHVAVVGSPGRRVALGVVAAACDAVSMARKGEAPGLGARTVHIDEQMNYPYGANLVQVEIDRDTGGVVVRRCHVSGEAGCAVNPLLVEGQIVGGVAQGLGGALLEELVYDADGQPRSTTFMDYLLPTASEVPRVETLILEDAPTPSNPLGAKGMGEAGIVGMGAAIASAVADALGRPGSVTALPLTPERVIDLIRGGCDD